MSNLLSLSICLASVAAAAGLIYLRLRWLRRDTERLRLREYWWSEFVDCCRPLLDDPETPLEALEALSCFNFAANKPIAPRYLYLRMRKAKPEGKGFTGEIQAFRKRRPELAKSLDRALLAGFLATTYQNSFWGVALRALAMDRAHRSREEAAYFVSQAKSVSPEPTGSSWFAHA